MAFTLYYASGSPYAWRVWLALEHKGVSYELKKVSFDAGDLGTDAYAALNPRKRVPVIVHDGFALYESAAIVEYIEELWPDAPNLFSRDLHRRAVERRMVREADQYFAEPLELLVGEVLFKQAESRSPHRIDEAYTRMKQELDFWETRIEGVFLAGDLSAADFTLYPEIALARRIGSRNPGLEPRGFIGANVAAWMSRMEALPVVQRTWPPHWRG
jgi:glutathione S-transferase